MVFDFAIHLFGLCGLGGLGLAELTIIDAIQLSAMHRCFVGYRWLVGCCWPIGRSLLAWLAGCCGLARGGLPTWPNWLAFGCMAGGPTATPGLGGQLL